MKNKQLGIMRIPGVGVSIAKDLRSLGIQEVSDLKQKDPEKLYTDLCAKQHAHTSTDACCTSCDVRFIMQAMPHMIQKN